MRVSIVSAISAVMVLVGSGVSAQEGGQVGLSMGFPASIGLIMHPTARFGLRAETTFGFSSSETEWASLLERETETNEFGVGLAGLFYVNGEYDVRPYVSPRFMYTKQTSQIEGSDLPIVLPQAFPLPLPISARELSIETSGYAIAGSFGAQYSPNTRFSVFGELGLEYTWVKSDTSRPRALEAEASSFGPRAAVGVVWYFN
jgi:hypothetical protein